MSSWKVKTSTGQEVSCSWTRMAQMLAAGEISEHDLACRADSADWEPLHSIPGVQRAVQVQRESSECQDQVVPPAEVESLRDELRSQSLGAVQVERVPAGSAAHLYRWVSVGLLIVGVLGVLVYVTRTETFPEPSGTPSAPLTLADILPPPPDEPTLDIPIGESMIVPGFEKERGVSCPTLTPDLLTIVYLKSVGGQNDLFLSRRSHKTEAFGEKIRLPCSTVGNDGFPAISPNGKELLFSVLGSPTRLYLSVAEDGFRRMTPVEFDGVDAESEHVDNTQWLDGNRIRVAVSDQQFRNRRHVVLRRTEQPGKAAFGSPEFLSLLNPWPRLWTHPSLDLFLFSSPDCTAFGVSRHSVEGFVSLDNQLEESWQLHAEGHATVESTVYATNALDAIFGVGPKSMLRVLRVM